MEWQRVFGSVIDTFVEFPQLFGFREGVILHHARIHRTALVCDVDSYCVYELEDVSWMGEQKF